MTITITTEDSGPALVVALEGRLDSSNAKTLEGELMPLIGDRAAVVLDFAKLTYISSAGLRTILIAGKRLRGNAGALALCNLPPAIREVFEISGFLSIFEVHDSREAAVAAVSG